MAVDYAALVEQQRKYIDKVLTKDKLRLPLMFLSSKIRKVKKAYLSHEVTADLEEEFLYFYNITDAIDRNRTYRFLNKCLHTFSDYRYEKKYQNKKSNIKKAISNISGSGIAIVCIIKNEARYIREWIAYYKLMGVDHIYLFNNGSTDNVREVLQKELEAEFVTLIDFTGANAQLPVYRLAVKYLRGKYRWVAFIDADEFIVPTNGDLKEYLAGKENCPAIGIDWVVFGTGGHKKRPEGLVTENYFSTFEDADNLLNLRIKCIVNPDEVYDVYSPHFCVLKNGRYAVDENGEEITTKWMYVSGSGPAFTGKNSTRTIRINHYWTKSEQDLLEKCNRGYAAGGFNPDYDGIMKRLDYPQKEDRIMEKFVPDIKRVLQEN